MTNLFFLATSTSSSSISTALGHEFIENLKLNGVELDLKIRDLSFDQLHNPDEEITNALRAGVENPTEAQAVAIEQSDLMIAELDVADIVLLGAPMNNFTISAQLRTYLDYVIRPGKTFGYSPTGPKGLLTDKPVFIISTRGGQYGEGSQDEPNPYDFQSGYLRHILSFIGLTSVEIIAANGMDMGDTPKVDGLAKARTNIKALAKVTASDLAA